ncbi:MAG: 6,7-dimethyl-8-ribityllumazine synthase [Candidatus Uhrbacteria bacterium]|nr:6,7-dimethyl-8-ribityllumazine synthase [Candidatus Uhrbacteria bacterium]
MNKKRIRVALVVTQFHKEISDEMIYVASETVEKSGATLAGTVLVPGCFEMPLAVKRLLSKKTVDAVVVLGPIEKGETLHGEVMGHVVCHALMTLQLAVMKPIGFGIIGPGATKEQARARMKGAAQGAVRAALSQVASR